MHGRVARHLLAMGLTSKKFGKINMDNLVKWRAELGHVDGRVRAAAAENLCHAGTASIGAAVELVNACGDEVDDVQSWAVAALEELGPPMAESIESLTGSLASPSPLVVYWSATLLGRLGPQAAIAQKALARVLANSQDIAAQERAAWAMGRIGVTADEAIANLKQASGSTNPRLARLARSALDQSHVH